VSESGAYYLCLLSMPEDLCWFCGEWLHAEEVEGGIEGPDGHRFCSGGCIEALARMKARDEYRKTNWCPACSYDNWEHAPDCRSGP
jgi:hypothetical protein